MTDVPPRAKRVKSPYIVERNRHEREFLIRALVANGRSLAATERALGIPRGSLSRKLTALGIDHRTAKPAPQRLPDISDGARRIAFRHRLHAGGGILTLCNDSGGYACGWMPDAKLAEIVAEVFNIGAGLLH